MSLQPLKVNLAILPLTTASFILTTPQESRSKISLHSKRICAWCPPTPFWTAWQPLAHLVPCNLLLDFGRLSPNGLGIGQFLFSHRQPLRDGLWCIVELPGQNQDLLQLTLPVETKACRNQRLWANRRFLVRLIESREQLQLFHGFCYAPLQLPNLARKAH